jgi:hypothetical protein
MKKLIASDIDSNNNASNITETNFNPLENVLKSNLERKIRNLSHSKHIFIKNI